MPHTPSRDDQIAAFYAAHADRLHRAVSSRARAATATVEDACQTAWLKLLRRPDITLDRQGFWWLVAVAVHEAWRLADTRHGQPSSGLNSDPGDRDGDDVPGPVDLATVGTEERVLAHVERVQSFQALKPREREALFLKALGYSYTEIAELTGSTYTAVNRRLREGRSALRGKHRTTGRPTAP